MLRTKCLDVLRCGLLAFRLERYVCLSLNVLFRVLEFCFLFPLFFLPIHHPFLLFPRLFIPCLRQREGVSAPSSQGAR